MKSVLFLIVLSMVTVVVHGSALGLEPRTKGGYLQRGSTNATFTVYSGCSTPGKHKPVVSHKNARTNTGIPVACGKVSYGYTAAINQLSFGAPGGQGAGDACGRCFKITGTGDPYSPQYTGPFYSIVVKVTNLCPYQEGEKWCGQSRSHPRNQYGAHVQ